MKRGSVLSMGIIALTMLISACSDSSSPISPTVNTLGNVEGDPGILASLQDPQVSVQVGEPGQVRLLFTAGASGTTESESMRAARIIESVEFEVRTETNALVDREMTTNVVTTGVIRPDDQASLTVFADSDWDSVEPIQRGRYLIGIVRGRNGEVLVTRAEISDGADN